MENISPSLHLLLTVRAALENGQSVRAGVLQFLSQHHGVFGEVVRQWLLLVDQNQPVSSLTEKLHPCRRALLNLLGKGLKGLPILNQIKELESEIIQSCNEEIETEIQKLPLLMMIPIFLFMFPAYLLLLFGPIIESLMAQI